MATSNHLIPPTAIAVVKVKNCGGEGNDTTDDDESEPGEPPNIHTIPYCRLKRDGAPNCIFRGLLSLGFLFAAVITVSYCDGSQAEEVVGRRGANVTNSRGIRGALEETPGYERHEQVLPEFLSGGDCSYECCTSTFTTRQLQSTPNTSNPCPPEEEGKSSMALPKAVQYILIVVLLLFSALFSGLTLGLMSLDPSGLQIVMSNMDNPALARAAKAIYPVRLNGNLLLCTLLWGNVGVNSLLSILMADLTSGVVGFIASTVAIVIFGEIIPQAFCSRYSLQIGEKTIPLVKVFIVLLYPICKPMSIVLNKVLGREIGTTYSASEMTKLIEMHVQGGQFQQDTGAAMTGALRYRTMAVNEVMTPLMNSFLLSADDRLGFDTVAKIFKTGYSRIPVYEVSKSNIIGLLFVKDLIFLDPEDEFPVKNFVQIFGRGLHIVWPDDTLGDVLKLLKTGRSHMALVRGVNEGDGKMDPFYEIKGIITLEDIVEVILGDEIVDETDQLVEVNDPKSVVQRCELGEYINGSLDRETNGPSMIGGGAIDPRSVGSIDWEARLRLLDERLVDEHLSPEEVKAVAAHLKTNYSNAMKLISDRQLKDLLSMVAVTDITPASTCATEDDGDNGDCSGVPTDHAEMLYERGVSADFCTVVLSGKIVVMSGADKFRSNVSNWGVLASRALIDPSYVPDFSAWVVANPSNAGGCRCVKLGRKAYNDAVDNTAVEKTDLKPRMLVIAGSDDKSSPLATNVERIKSPSKFEVSQCPTKPLSSSPCPQTIDQEIDHVEPVTYVRSDSQNKIHTQRSKLLHAFMNSTK